MSTAAAVILFIAIIGYSIFGGADFGAGFWDLTAGGTDPTIWAVAIATGIAIVLVFPAFGLLYRLDQKGLLPEEGVPDAPPATG